MFTKKDPTGKVSTPIVIVLSYETKGNLKGNSLTLPFIKPV